MKSSTQKYKFLIFLLLLGIKESGIAQQVFTDKGIYSEGLWCFPLATDSMTYVYLPSQARLATNEKGGPRFSYLRYIINKPNEGNSNKSITDADGGGILHFLVLYDTPEKQIKAAEENIKKKLKQKEIKLKGPIVFEKGSYVLVSSILNPDNGKEEKKVIAKGDAPVLENSSIALSFSLTPVQSKLLLESFKMKTPDISLVFDLGFLGLSDAYDAELEINWSEVSKSKAFKAGGSVYFIGADVEVAFDNLRRESAIKLKSSGSSESMEGLLHTVYEKLLSLMFAPAQQENATSQGGLGSALESILDPNGPLGSRKTTGFGLNVGYKTKERQNSGTSRLFFKGRSTTQRHHYVTFNIGNVYGQYGKDPTYFKDVPLWDPTFQQREIFVGVDGDLEKEFKKMLNSVSVFMSKKHDSGNTTLQNVVITKETFKTFNKPLAVVYGCDADSNRIKWMDYQYRSIWQFQGGTNYETPWETTSAAMINLYTPFNRKTILLDGNLETLKDSGVRMVSIKVNYDFFGKNKEHRITIRPGDNISEKFFDITLPANIEEVDYELTWMRTDGIPITKKGKDKYGLIFIDEMPK
jgi:hypothetical protein